MAIAGQLFSLKGLTPRRPRRMLRWSMVFLTLLYSRRSETMATVSVPPTSPPVDYPTSDGRPMAETELHRDLILELIETLKAKYVDDPNMYVSGNLLVYYVRETSAGTLLQTCLPCVACPSADEITTSFGRKTKAPRRSLN